MKCHIILLLTLLLSTTLLSCNSSDPTSSDSTSSLVGDTTDHGPPVLTPSTIVVSDEGGTVHPVISQSDSTLVLTGIRNDIKPGSIVLSTVGKGALREVQSVDLSNGNTSLITTQASLPQAYEYLHLRETLPFSQETIGKIESDVPGLTFDWVTSRTVKEDPSVANLSGDESLELSFKNVALSVSPDETINGTTKLHATPDLYYDFNRVPGDILPTCAYFRTGLAVTLQSNLLFSKTKEGEINISRRWIDEDLKSIPIGALRITPHLKVESSFVGKVSKEFAFTYQEALTVVGSFEYVRGKGWTAKTSVTPQRGGAGTASSSMSVGIKPLTVEISFRVFGVGGPYLAGLSELQSTGTAKTVNGQSCLEFVANASAKGNVGLMASSPEFLSKLFRLEWKNQSEPFAKWEKELFRMTTCPSKGVPSLSCFINGKKWVAESVIPGNSIPSSTEAYPIAYRNIYSEILSFHIDNPHKGNNSIDDYDAKKNFAFAMLPSGSNLSSGSWYSRDGSGGVSITRMDDRWIEGTFSFLLYSKEDPYLPPVLIDQGQFSIPY